MQKASLTGSLVSAFLASICCIGPVVFAILGVSGAAFIQKFEGYRIHFIAATVALLGTSFYLTYRKPPPEQCLPGSYCANPKSDRLNKIILWISTVFVLAFIFFPQLISLLQ